MSALIFLGKCLRKEFIEIMKKIFIKIPLALPLQYIVVISEFLKGNFNMNFIIIIILALR